MPTVEELRKQLREAEEAERRIGQDEYAAIKKSATFEWRVTPKPFGFHVACRYDEASTARVAAWKQAFPKAATYNFREPDEWQGMTYILGYTRDGEPFLYGGGGSVILDLKSTFDPTPITRAQAAQFEEGIVPEELKKPW